MQGGAALALTSLWPRSPWAAPAELLAHSPRPQQLATPLEAFDRLLTPNDLFFIRSHLTTPAMDPTRRVTVGGLVSTPLELTVKALGAFPQVTVTAVLQCAGNGRALFKPRMPGVQWVYGAMGQATWTGVRLGDVLAKAGVKPGAAHVHLKGADAPPRPQTPPFFRSIPLEKALPDTLLCTRMNGEPLPLEHGGPVRVVVPGWAGDHWLKWLTHIELAADELDTFFVKTGYRVPSEPVAPGAAVPPEKMIPVTVMPVKSVIARPLEGATVKRGPLEVVGVAFSGFAGIAKVEVSADGGATWLPASLEGEAGMGRWQVFRAKVKAESAGELTLLSRATDAKGNVQPQEAAWNPAGYHWNAWHRVPVKVA